MLKFCEFFSTYFLKIMYSNMPKYCMYFYCQNFRIGLIFDYKDDLGSKKGIYVSCHQQKYEEHLSFASFKLEFKACKREKSRKIHQFSPKIKTFPILEVKKSKIWKIIGANPFLAITKWVLSNWT